MSDNAALYHATQDSEEVFLIFVFDKNILDKLPDSKDKRITFIWQCLEDINETISSLGSRMFTFYGTPTELIPQLVDDLGIEAIYFNRDYEPYAINRDKQVTESLRGKNIAVHSFKDMVIFEGAEVLKDDGSPYTVYTPYSKKWKSRFSSQNVECYVPNLKTLAKENKYPNCNPVILNDIGFKLEDIIFPGGEFQAKQKLHDFYDSIDSYHENRDFPFLNGTSGLSVHFRFGTISIREAIRFIYDKPMNRGREIWLNEIIWREFYQSILYHFPYVERESFKKEYKTLDWPGEMDHFHLWCRGETGYPIVDAAMRCLNSTGWMHNRLRMIAASFLVKDLLIDWRLGERYFAEKLLDYDLASNNGGWQWCASTGVDAQPYFRIFNPYLQSKKFDPEGEFIKKWCPELSGYNSKWIHTPHLATSLEMNFSQCVVGKDYPLPVVEHAKQKDLVLKLFRG